MADLATNATTAIAEPAAYDWKAIIDDLNALLRLRTTPIGMKMFATVEEMEAIPKIRRPKSIHTTDQIVAQAARLGWTVGITMKDLVGAQCGAVIGLHPRDEDWLSGKAMAGVWYSTLTDSSAHQHAMDTAPHGRYLRDGGVAARLGTPQSSRYMPHLWHPGSDDHLHQRASVGGLQEVPMGRRRRVGLRRFMGPRAQDGRAEPLDTVLRGTALRRRARRGDADGDSAALPPKDYRGDEAARLAMGCAIRSRSMAFSPTRGRAWR